MQDLRECLGVKFGGSSGGGGEASQIAYILLAHAVFDMPKVSSNPAAATFLIGLRVG